MFAHEDWKIADKVSREVIDSTKFIKSLRQYWKLKIGEKQNLDWLTSRWTQFPAQNFEKSADDDDGHYTVHTRASDL